MIEKITLKTKVDENENYICELKDYKLSNIKLKCSQPVNEGNLILRTVKVQNQNLYDKTLFKTFDYINSKSNLKTKYKNIDEIKESNNVEIKIKLENTITNPELELSQTTFSTLKPTDVEFRIKLNNNKIESDIYGDSVFEILLPEYIETFEILDYSMIYGDGINLTNVETYYNDTGGLVLKAIVEGIQNDISSGLTTQGTNIIINSRVTIDEIAPTLEEELILTYTNSEVTNYEKENDIQKIKYISPPGDTSNTNLEENLLETEDVIEVMNIEENGFDLQLTQSVSKVTIHNKKGTIEKEFDDSKLAEIEISKKNLDSAVAYIDYKIEVENQGDVGGYAKSIVSYIPNDLIFDSNLNPDWYESDDGNLYTTALANEAIESGENKEIQLTLIKQMTEENTGIINNTAEIIESYNIYGLENMKLKSGYELKNDSDSADVIISVKKGEVFIYTSIILTTILLSSIVIFLIINKWKIFKRKEGGV